MLNETQKQILEATFNFIFATISDDVPVEIGLKALAAMNQENAYEVYKGELQQHDLLELVDQVARIYAHPYPQNRSLGSPYVGQTEGWVAWEPNGHNQGVERERQGLLGLTAHNTEGTAGVTKEDVCNYINDEIGINRLKLTARRMQNTITQQSASINREVHHVDFSAIFAFVQAVAGFYEAFKNELRDHPEITEKSAAASYMTSVLNAIRKDDWENFLKNPEQTYLVPNKLKNFIEIYIRAHPILLAAKEYKESTKNLETQFNNESLNNVEHIQSRPQLLSNKTAFWSSTATHNSSLNIHSFIKLICEVVEDWQKKLSVFPSLDKMTANIYMSKLIKAIKQDKLKEFVDDPVSHGIEKEYWHIVGDALSQHPTLAQGSVFGKRLGTIEYALMTLSMEEIKQMFGVVQLQQERQSETSAAPQPSPQ